MVLRMRSGTVPDETNHEEDREIVTITTLLLPRNYQPAFAEPSSAFELIRLAFFVLKRRKLEQAHLFNPESIDVSAYNLQCNLLQHAIFQQLLCLTRLGARPQALRLITS